MNRTHDTILMHLHTTYEEDDRRCVRTHNDANITSELTKSLQKVCDEVWILNNAIIYIIYLKDEPRDLPGMIDAIKGTLKIIDEVKVSVSAYDTAWVALVKNQAEGGDGPQFPSSIDWIAQNQLADGSWGDKTFFLIHDRIINTLACIIALKSWNVHDDKYNKGRYMSLYFFNIKNLAPLACSSTT